ncbi:MAG: DUF308 domain-containing protein [Lactobacillus sp.]|jgi:uncharacterized membrane protein HdeD (DUF308 family)|nr:DUF308 domain-containing protein [Lactobacillus sp.]MCH3989778.1 DUF308 domain-containing protein [Lactobacillus sp.]MCH4068056.1 DUF308 domain-containing protein [Lactobacillus sp.]MCI1303988.1 DUF308 domain-containing protein [Lactobacillus sp.]MCI1329986.1 DUF308 domain-containing protein [Lactobacillus sp.]
MFSFSRPDRQHGFDWGVFIAGVISCLLSFVMLRNPGQSLRGLVVAFSIVSIMQGIMWLSSYSWFRDLFGISWVGIVAAVVDIIIGIIFLFYQEIGAVSLGLILGIWFLIDSISGIAFSGHLRFLSTGYFIFDLIMNILTLILSIMLLLHPIASAFSLVYLVAFYLLLFGINEIVLAWMHR